MLASPNKFGAIGQERAAKAVEKSEGKKDPGPKPRVLNAVTLNVLRRTVANIEDNPCLALYKLFLRRICARENEVVVSKDPSIPQIIYEVQFVMDDQQFKTYNDMLEKFNLTCAVEKLHNIEEREKHQLKGIREEFEFAGIPATSFNLSSCLEATVQKAEFTGNLDHLLRSQVQAHDLGTPYSAARGTGRIWYPYQPYYQHCQ
ncbi:hypothetical protein BCR34DRAFT_601383 [Clohesyomyces aquaticus]|uniref:Uncharacterized protein n=1 Tax=Clohesyomyces aquaticus TaxID=1231657 RepID=A0A1Y1ZMI5_9PLEO|nr:hypothetical protein BCR34DRAFT_601383 [Clohesyomyces aquaticus]